MSASLSGSGTWKGFGGGGERDFIEHINLNLVTANRCLIKGVHITHIHFFFLLLESSGAFPSAGDLLAALGCEERGWPRAFAGGDVYFAVIVGSLPWIILLLQI